MKSTAKSVAQFRELKVKLQQRVKGSASIDTVAESLDANGWPMLKLSNGGAVAAGDEVILLRMKAEDAVSKDVFGNANLAFSPHAIELAYELDGAGKQTPSQLDLAKVLQEVCKCGIKLEVKEIANGTAVDEAAINAAAVAASLEFEVMWPTKGI